ncbi:MAG: archaellin/type IV pilin N-terminal domain-containing protein [Nanobdellota archaeon]
MFTNKSAEMGIGTLIIFIALLLVAAVAAGVLIQTSGSLQEKALTTGDQAKSQIATNAKVVEVSATDGRQGGLRYFTQIVKLAPGSESMKLDQTIVTFNTFDKTATLQYVNGTSENNCSTGYCTINSTGNYTVEYLQTGSNHVPGNLQRGDVIKIYYEAPKNVTESEEVRINLIPKIGTPTLTKFVTPEVISTERVYLYP